MSWEQTGNSLRAAAHYVESKVGKTGLTVTVDVWRNGAAIVTGASATEVGGGFYEYVLHGGTFVTVEGLYLFLFKTATSTVDQQEIPAAYLVGLAGVENLDAAVSSRASADNTEYVIGVVDQLTADLATKPTAAEAADAVWDESLAGHMAAGSTGEALDAAGAAADPLLSEVPGDYLQGTAGFALGRIGTGRVEAVQPFNPTTGTLTLVRGDDYDDADGRALSFTATDWPDLTGVTSVTLTVRRRPQAFRGEGTDDVLFSVADTASLRDVGPPSQAVYFEPSSEDTEALLPGVATGKYDVEALLGGRRITLVTGLVATVEDQTR
jgi:hypothetical protein